MKVLIILIFLISTSFAKEVLKAGVFSISPYGYIENKTIKGILPDIIEEIERNVDVSISISLYPYSRMLRNLEAGEIDFAIFFVSDLSEKISTKIIPLYSLRTIAVAQKGLVLNEFSDLKKYNLVTPRGVRYGAGLNKSGGYRLNFVSNYRGAIYSILKKHSQVIIAPEKILMNQLKKENISRDKLGSQIVLTTNTAWLQFSNKSNKRSHIQKIKNVIEKLKSNGFIKSTIDSHYKKHPTP